MIRKVIGIFVIIFLWQMAALSIDSAVILPLPWDVFKHMLDLATTSIFYQAILNSLLRITISFILAATLGISLGLLAGLHQQIEDYLFAIMALFQTIPQIAYILILIVLFQNNVALIMIICFMILPVFYNNVVAGIHHIDQELKDVIILYHQPISYNIFHVYLPLIQGYLLSAIDTCLPLSFKICVMAEIFVQSTNGIGVRLYFARTQIDMIGIFSWTIWMVILLFLLTTGYQYIKKKIRNVF